MGTPRLPQPLKGRPSDWGPPSATEQVKAKVTRQQSNYPAGFQEVVDKRIQAHAERVAREEAAILARGGAGTKSHNVPASVARAAEPVQPGRQRKRRGTNRPPKGDEVDRVVPACRRADFRRFLATGEADEAFRRFLATHTASWRLWQKLIGQELQGEAA